MRAVVLLSGGLDSAVCLWWARARGWKIDALSVRYGQRHARELASARRLAKAAGARHHELRVAMPWLKTSALVDRKKRLPDVALSRIGAGGVPTTYVPGRNTVFLALAASLADAVGADAVVIGSNSLDYSGYPDCRPEYNRALERALRLGTRRRGIRVVAPLARKDKAQIAGLALRLKVPVALTWSCYRGGRRPCGACDSCKLRAKGFSEAGAADPA